jgi:hypothetical protein
VTPSPAAVRATALRAACAVGAAAALGALNLHRPATFCPLRAFTGIPCPICGTTTAGVRIGRGDVLGALAANPVTVLAAVLLVAAPLLAGRVRLPHRAAVGMFTGSVAFAWLWQLARFDRLPL